MNEEENQNNRWVGHESIALLAVLGLAALITSYSLPSDFLNIVRPGKLPLFDTIIRGWFYAQADVPSFELALRIFAAWSFGLAAIALAWSRLIRPWVVTPTNKRPTSGLAIAVLIVSLISIGIRLHTLNRPLGARHDEITANSLMAQTIWNERGGAANWFVANHTFANPADRNIRQGCGTLDAEGNCYYTSYPPFAFMLPYLSLSAIGLEPSLLRLQMFDILLHLLSAGFVLCIVRLVTRKLCGKPDNTAAALGFAFYALAPIALMMHSNGYSSEMTVLPFFIGGTYFFLKIILAKDPTSSDTLLFGLFAFLATYTEWLGMLFAGCAGIYVLLFRRDLMLRVFVPAALCSVAALTLTAIQFNAMIGIDVVFAALKQKLLVRTSALSHPRTDIISWLQIAFAYWRNFDFILLLTTIALYINLMRTGLRAGIATIRTKPLHAFLFVAGVPILLHHLLLFQWTAVHDFSPLKSTIVISVIGALAVGNLLRNPRQSKQTRVRVWKFGICAAYALSVLSFMSKTAYVNDVYVGRGEVVRAMTKQTTSVFGRSIDVTGKNIEFSHGSLYSMYSHRNVAPWTDLESALELMRKNGTAYGILFEFRDHVPTDIRYTRFTRDSTTEEVEAALRDFGRHGY